MIGTFCFIHDLGTKAAIDASRRRESGARLERLARRQLRERTVVGGSSPKRWAWWSGAGGQVYVVGVIALCPAIVISSRIASAARSAAGKFQTGGLLDAAHRGGAWQYLTITR